MNADETFSYKGYVGGEAEFSPEDNLFVGKVLYTKNLIMFEGKDCAELAQSFQDAVDHYESHRGHVYSGNGIAVIRGDV